MNDAVILISVLLTALAILTGGALFLLALILLASLRPARLRSGLQRFLCRISFDCFGRGGFGG